MSTIYGSFVDAHAAERAVGALLDNDARQEDISVVAHEDYHAVRGERVEGESAHAEDAGKHGISTTTSGDVATGAVKGLAGGFGVGIAAAVVSMLIPGIGLVLGAGALATAIAGAAATTAAGTIVGGVVGYLKDQGLPQEAIAHYSNQLDAGGAIVAISVPTGELTASHVESILSKYGATGIATYNSSRPSVAGGQVVEVQTPIAINNPNIDPLAVTQTAVVATPVYAQQVVVPSVPVTPVSSAVVVDSVTGTETLVASPAVGTVVDPLTGTPRMAVVDPITGNMQPAAIDPVTGERVVATPVVVEPVTRVETHTVIDAETGESRIVQTEPVVTNQVVGTVVERDGPELI